jgi:2-keto-myo-inositol isomerase
MWRERLMLPSLTYRRGRWHVGEGILPLDHDLKLIKSIGYDGFLSVEIFREDYWREPVGKVIADAKAAIDRWLAKGH